MSNLGNHILVEYYNCNSDFLNDVVHIEKAMVEAAEKANATVINSTFHYFSPFGVSGVVVVQESHLAIHTWPEFEYAAVDIFTCGDSVDPWIAFEIIKNALGSEYGSAMEMNRGQMKLLKKGGFSYDSLGNEYEKNEISEIKKTRDIWFTEKNKLLAFSFKHKGDLLFNKKSDFQQVKVYDTFAYGKMLTIDGMVMCTEKDEPAYHEMIAHVPLMTKNDIKRILVIGGGDGGTIRELVRHQNVEKVIMVEIDEVVIEASKKHLPTFSCEFNNPKVELLIDDGIKYVKESADESFDLVIVDSTDPVGPGEGLFTYDFYRNVYRILSKDGIMVTQSESPSFTPDLYKDLYKCYREIYGKEKVKSYLAHIPTYPTGLWSFSFCSKGNTNPLSDFDENKYENYITKHKLKYYNKELHFTSFVMPNNIKELLEN